MDRELRKMRIVVTFILILLVGFSGCIRHSNQPLKRNLRKQTEEKANFRRLTPNLMVNDVNKTIDFYKKAFGFYPVVTVPDTGVYNLAIVSSGRVEVMFQKKENFIEDLGLNRDTVTGGSMVLYIEVSDIIAVYEKASLVADIVKDLHQTFFGTKEFSVRDNNGYILTFSEAMKK